MEILVQPLQRRLAAEPGANLLDLLRAHGLPVSYSCLAGRCGTCRCRVLDGELLDGAAPLQRPLAVDRQVLACQATLTGPCTVEIPDVDEPVVHPARVLKAVVVANEVLTHDIRRLRLKPNKPLDFTPGQYAQLQFAPDLARPYSMAGLPGDELLEFHVRLVPGGRAGAHVAGVLKPGDTLRVSGPLGTAYLRRRHAGPVLCVAGGTGLAPVLSILRGAASAGLTSPTHLYVGARTPADVYGLDELRDLQARLPALRVQVVVASGEAPGARHGLVTEAIARDWPALAGFRAYLCGSPAMVEATQRLVTARGLDPALVHADAFYPSL